MAPLAELSALSGPVISSSDQSRSREVLIRAASALAMMSLLAGCLYGGWPFFHLLVLAATVIMAREWARLCGRGVLGPGGYALIAACAGIVVLASFALHVEASLVFIAAVPLVALMATSKRVSDAFWLGAGVLYVGGGTWAAIALFDLYQYGVWIVVWIFLVVALTDIGAFLAGRTIGGPKLAPRLSPKKTWSGFFGGLLCAALGGLLFAVFIDRSSEGFHIVAAIVIGLVAQVGDLFESLLKRRFDAKDSGSLIPGHGGLLDRVDGVVAAMIVVAAIAWIRGGVETPWP